MKTAAKPDNRLAMIWETKSRVDVVYVLNSIVGSHIEALATYLGFGCSDYRIERWDELPLNWYTVHWVMSYRITGTTKEAVENGRYGLRLYFQPVDKPREFVFKE